MDKWPKPCGSGPPHLSDSGQPSPESGHGLRNGAKAAFFPLNGREHLDPICSWPGNCNRQGQMLTLTRTISGFVFLAAALCAFADPMTQAEREHLVAHLEMTQSWLTDEVSSLSTAQLNFRPSPDRWTVAEVVQHLVVAEPNYWKLLQDALKQPPRKLGEQATDADVLWYGIDRTRHEKTSADQNPKDQVIDAPQALKTFLKMHAQLLQMARTTNEDLRGHAVPEWQVDAYQCLLEISTHEQRHILQIREIKSSAGFPKR